MNLESIQALQFIIIALLSYLPTVAISGWFEAWVAKKCGDDIPEQFGFLTFDPLIHFNIMGFGFLLIGSLLGNYVPFLKDIPGWGTYIPLNPSDQSSWKAMLQFNARAIAHLLLTIIALFIIIYFIKTGQFNFNPNSPIMPSATITSAMNVVTFFYNQNLALCYIYFAIGAFRSIIFYYFPNFYLFSTQHVLWGAFILFGTIIICAEAFRFIISRFLWFIMLSFLS